MSKIIDKSVGPEEVWKILREVAEMSKETDRKFQETERQIQEVKQMFLETDRKFQETDRRFQETDRRFQETDRQFKASDKRIQKLDELFTSQWGRLMESLVEGDLIAILNARGIAVTDTTMRLKGKRKDGGNYEFDIIAHNGKELVVIEVKTTLRPDDVKLFVDKLGHIKQWIPRYAENTIYGAMAWLTAVAGAVMMLSHKGLLSIRATGNSASIVNESNFTPKAW
jgi:Holliday junction resolvase-like predicted endonuclease